MKSFASIIITLGLFAACGGGSGVSIVGETPENQADAVAGAICDEEVSCGEASVDCTVDPNTQALDCVGTIEPVTYQACYDDIYPDALADFTACDLTAEQEGQIEDCIDALLAQPCITQEELDAYATQVEMGSEEPLREQPPECVAVEAIFESCGTPQ